MPASRAISCCTWPTRTATTWAVVKLLRRRKCSFCRTRPAAGAVVGGANEVKEEITLCTVACALAPVLGRGRTEELLFAGGAQWLITAIGGEVAVLRNVAAVGAGLDLLLRPVGWAERIIVIVADAVAEIVVELAAARVLIVRRVVRLAELLDVR